MLSNHQSRREINTMEPPWFQNPPAAGGVIMCSRRNMVFIVGNDNGSAVNAMRLEGDTLGAIGAGVSSSIYLSNFNNTGVGYLECTSSGTSGIVVDPWAVALSGTAKPFTFIFTGQNAAGGAPENAARLVSFGHSTLTNPVTDITYANTGDTAFFLVRRNNAGNTAPGPVYDPGFAPFVSYHAYDGVNLYSSLNGGAVTTTPFNAGALTLNLFAIGFFPAGGNLPSQPNVVGSYFDTQCLTGQAADSLIRYFCRLIRI